MALSGSTQWDVRQGATANDVNGGGFNPGNTNMATDLAATSGTSSGPVVTSASYTFVAGDAGAMLFIKSGTNWNPGWYPIASVAGGAATLNAASGSWEVYNATDPTRSPIYQSTSAGCASVASPSGGTWSVDYSRQNAAQFAYTDLLVDGTTNTRATSAAHPFGANCVGNVVNVTGGTGFTVQRSEIVSVSGAAATADKSWGTLSSAGGTGNLGGAFSSPGGAVAVATVGGMDVWWKYSATAYTTTTATAGSNGPISFATSNILLCGYDQARGDRTGNLPTITWGAAAPASNSYLIITNNNGVLCENVAADGANTAKVCGINDSVRAAMDGCVALNCSGTGTFGFTLSGPASYCEASGCATGFSGSNASNCVATGCTTGFSCPGQGVMCDCVATGCTTGFSCTGTVAKNCTADSCSSKGFLSTSSINPCVFDSCIASNMNGAGARGFDVLQTDMLRNCAGYNNTTHINGTPALNLGWIAVGAQPYATAGSDLRLNANSPGGAQARAMGTAVYGQPADNRDVGALQHADPPAGGGPFQGYMGMP